MLNALLPTALNALLLNVLNALLLTALNALPLTALNALPLTALNALLLNALNTLRQHPVSLRTFFYISNCLFSTPGPGRRMPRAEAAEQLPVQYDLQQDPYAL